MEMVIATQRAAWWRGNGGPLIVEGRNMNHGSEHWGYCIGRPAQIRPPSQLWGLSAAAAVHADFTWTWMACAHSQDRDLGVVQAARAGGKTALSPGTAALWMHIRAWIWIWVFIYQTNMNATDFASCQPFLRSLSSRTGQSLGGVHSVFRMAPCAF